MKNKNYFTYKKEYTTCFTQIPNTLIYSQRYVHLSINSKYLYALLLDRTQLSLKNHYLDSKGRAYIFFSREEAAKILGCGLNTSGKVFKELVSADLIEEVQQRGKRANIIYVKMPIESQRNEENVKKAKEAKKVLAQKRREYLKKINTSIKVKQSKLAALKKKLAAMKKEFAQKPILTIQESDIEKIKEQIDYNYFTYACPEQLPIVDQIVQSMAEMSVSDSTKINGCYHSAIHLLDTLSSVDTNCILDLADHIRNSVSWGSVRHKTAYLKSLIYNFVSQRELEIAAFSCPGF